LSTPPHATNSSRRTVIRQASGTPLSGTRRACRARDTRHSAGQPPPGTPSRDHRAHGARAYARVTWRRAGKARFGAEGVPGVFP